MIYQEGPCLKDIDLFTPDQFALLPVESIERVHQFRTLVQEMIELKGFTESEIFPWDEEALYEERGGSYQIDQLFDETNGFSEVGCVYGSIVCNAEHEMVSTCITYGAFGTNTSVELTCDEESLSIVLLDANTGIPISVPLQQESAVYEDLIKLADNGIAGKFSIDYFAAIYHILYLECHDHNTAFGSYTSS